MVSGEGDDGLTRSERRRDRLDGQRKQDKPRA